MRIILGNIIAFIMLLHSLYGRAANDSLEKSIFNLRNDTTKVNALFDLAMEIRNKDSLATITYIHYMLSLSESLHFEKGEAKAYYALGSLFYDKNSHKTAIDYFKKSMVLSAKVNYSEGVLNCYYYIARSYRRIADYPNYEKYLALLKLQAVKTANKEYLSYAYEGYGNLYRYIGDYSQSIVNYTKAIELSKELGNFEDVSVALNNLSLVYEYQQKFDKVLEVQLQDYAILQMLQNEREMVLCLSNLSNTYRKLGGNEKSDQYINKAMTIIRKEGEGNINYKAVANAYSQFAYSELLKKNYTTALEYYGKEFNLKKKNNDIKGICDSYGNLATVHYEMGDLNIATDYYKKQLSMAHNLGYVNGQLNALESLIALKVKQENYKDAYLFMKQFMQSNKTIMNKESAKQMAEVETRLKVNEQQQHIQLLLKDNAVRTLELEREKVNSYTLTLGIFLLLSIALIAFWGYNQKKRVNKELAGLVAERTKILNRRNKDLKDFIYRSSHELRSPIATTQGLINIILNEETDPKTTKECLQKISEVANRQDLLLQSLLKVHVLVDNKINPENIQVENLLNEIMDNLKYSSYAKGINMITDVPKDLEIKTDKLIFTSIIENLVINAMKYKRQKKEPSYVKVEAITDKNGILIKVSDNGQGIADDWKENIFRIFMRASNEPSGFGLGLYIVHNSVELLGGNITVKSKLHEGSEFSVWLPDNQKRKRINKSKKRIPSFFSVLNNISLK